MSPDSENQYPAVLLSSKDDRSEDRKIVGNDELPSCTIPSSTSFSNPRCKTPAGSKVNRAQSPRKIRKTNKKQCPSSNNKTKKRGSIAAPTPPCRKAKAYRKSDWIPQQASNGGTGTRKLVYVSNDQSPVQRVCYESIRHVRAGVELRERDCVEVSSNEATSYIGKIARLYHEPSTGELTASVLWYYRPEQIDLERMGGKHQINKTVHIEGLGNQELFTSRHFDAISVDSIQRPCFVLTFNEYVRNRKEHLKDSRERDQLIHEKYPQYPRQSRQPTIDDSNCEEIVYFARYLFDFASNRFISNPTRYNAKSDHERNKRSDRIS